MNRKDPNFSDLTGAIQVRFRELREKVVGAHVRHAPVVLPNEECSGCFSCMYFIH